MDSKDELKNRKRASLLSAPEETVVVQGVKYTFHYSDRYRTVPRADMDHIGVVRNGLIIVDIDAIRCFNTEGQSRYRLAFANILADVPDKVLDALVDYLFKKFGYLLITMDVACPIVDIVRKKPDHGFVDPACNLDCPE